MRRFSTRILRSFCWQGADWRGTDYVVKRYRAGNPEGEDAGLYGKGQGEQQPGYGIFMLTNILKESTDLDLLRVGAVQLAARPSSGYRGSHGKAGTGAEPAGCGIP